MGNFGSKYTKEILSEKILLAIKLGGIFTRGNACKKINVSNSTLVQFSVDVDALFREANVIRSSTFSDYNKAWVRAHLEQRLRLEIEKQDRYLPLREAADLLGIDPSTFSTKGISVRDINNLLGFVTPRKGISQHWSKEQKDRYIQNVEDTYKSLIINSNRTVFIREIAEIFGVSIGSIAQKIRDPREIHEECGVPYRTLSIKEICEISAEVIIRLNRYVSLDQLVQETGIKETTLNKAIISVIDFNESLGFKGGYSTFEDRTYELLRELLPNTEIIRQMKFHDLVSNTGRKLAVDFYIPEYLVAIEADGSQHWDASSRFHTTRGVYLDSLKDAYCLQNDITLLRLKYNQRLTINHIRNLLSGIPLKLSIGQPAAEPVEILEGSETIRKE